MSFQNRVKVSFVTIIIATSVIMSGVGSVALAIEVTKSTVGYDLYFIEGNGMKAVEVRLVTTAETDSCKTTRFGRNHVFRKMNDETGYENVIIDNDVEPSEIKCPDSRKSVQTIKSEPAVLQPKPNGSIDTSLFVPNQFQIEVKEIN